MPEPTKPMTAHEHYESARTWLDSAESALRRGKEEGASAAAKIAGIHVMLGDRTADLGGVPVDFGNTGIRYVRPLDWGDDRG